MPGASLAAQRLRDLMASVRDVGPSQTAGITSGAGNQGSANTANLLGHAGTPSSFLGLPRQLKQGAFGSKPQ
jgi:hypothetical protein